MTFISGVTAAQSDTSSQPYARTNAYGILAAYSNDSSHILLGSAENRKFFELGVSYSRTLLLTNHVHWQYQAEFQPIAVNSDPIQVADSTVTFTSPPVTFTTRSSSPTLGPCHSGTSSETDPPVYVQTVFTCTRRWVMGQALSPFGLQWNFMPTRTLQPIVTGHGGYLYSTKSIPVNGAGAFNFTFDLGVGFELYRSRTRSIRAEYRYHHISNKETATRNPGIDNGVIQVSYVFGR